MALQWKATAIGLSIAMLPLLSMAEGSAILLRDRVPSERPTLMIMGTAHLSNPGKDIVNLKVDSDLTPVRQGQIVDVTKELAAYRPTMIAVEWPQREQIQLDERYQRYLAGKYTLGAAEQDQFGLRLAAQLRLPRVFAIDWNETPAGYKKYYDWYSYGEAPGQRALVEAIIDPRHALGVISLGSMTIGAWLRKLNAPEALAANNRNYFDIARVGDAEQQPGANWVGYWYGRNLRIFNNIVRLTARPTDRVLVIYGQGHAYLLRRFALESGAFRLAAVSSVLKDP